MYVALAASLKSQNAIPFLQIIKEIQVVVRFLGFLGLLHHNTMDINLAYQQMQYYQPPMQILLIFIIWHLFVNAVV